MLFPMQAIFKAIDGVKREDWFRHTVVFLYRGAWQVCCCSSSSVAIGTGCLGVRVGGSNRDLDKNMIRPGIKPAPRSPYDIPLLQEWAPYEADMAVPMTSSDLSLKVTPYTAGQPCASSGFPVLWSASLL